jgi:hypothetical protein
MSKSPNYKNKNSHRTRRSDVARSETWKHGKSSGKTEKADKTDKADKA